MPELGRGNGSCGVEDESLVLVMEGCFLEREVLVDNIGNCTSLSVGF